MKKALKISLCVLSTLVIIAAAGFFLYVSDYYHAEEQAEAVMNAGEDQEGSIMVSGKLTILEPALPNGTGFIFYPGGKVEHTAYLPLLKRLSNMGITCVLVKMPFRLAVFDVNAADQVYDKLPDIHSWYIGGHSLGGAMAGSYASKHMDELEGLILLGSYIYGDIPASKALTIYGSEDQVLDRSKIDYTENVFQIQGGNHAQFGNYGPQKGDGEAQISSDSQQEQAAELISAFIGK